MHTVAAATDRGLTGWVRNLPSGTTVEGQAQGSKDALAGFLREVDRGPPGSHVVRLDQREIPFKPGEAGFRKVRSYETPPEP